jgi:hypothetical protein
MRTFLRNNGLSLVLGSLFLALLVAQVFAGQRQYNQERAGHGEGAVALREYLGTGHFVEATAENWESEFLQMAAYVLLTAFLYQKGSSESKTPGERESVDRDPRKVRKHPSMPWPVRQGGWVLRLYEYSLSIAFLVLFAVSFVLHAIGGMRLFNEEQLAHGSEPLSLGQYMATAQFWFESFQNWQSEFLAIVSMVLLSIVLRHRGSPESKPVDAPHSHTGTD